MPENFGCCSSHLDCQSAKKCCHEGEEMYRGCALLKRVGPAWVEDSKKPEEIHYEKRPALYIAAFHQFYKVYKKDSRNWYSWELQKEQYERIKEVFDHTGIPYQIDISYRDNDIGKPEELFTDITPCNSRIIFLLGADEFTVYNCYGCRLIPEEYAEKLAKALTKKGIKARCEVNGIKKTPTQNNYIPAHVHAVKPAPEPEPDETEFIKTLFPSTRKAEPARPPKQMSVFDLLMKSG